MKKQGFTLVELMTVVLILAILSSIAIPQYTKSVRRAEMMEGLANGKTLLDSALRFKAANGEAPTDFNQIDAAFMGMNFSGVSIDDGNFTYELVNERTQTDGIKVISNAGDYTLRFIYPFEDTNGVYAPIACCPSSSWICQNTAVGDTPTGDSSATGIPVGCREVK